MTSFETADIKAVFDIEVENAEFSNELLQAYYQEAFKQPTCNSASFKSSFSHLTVS